MSGLRGFPFIIGLVVLTACTTAMCQEPNQPKIELNFEVNTEGQKWITDHGIGQGPISPTHVAVLFIRSPHYMPNFNQPAAIDKVLNAPAGKLMSQKQRDFVSAARAFCRLNLSELTMPNHYNFHLYAVSELDARNMAKAFIEDLTNIADANRKALLDERQRLQVQINELKNDISETEAELKGSQTELEGLKGKVHYLTMDEAEQAVLELNKMLDVIDVETAGLQAKVLAIGKFKSGNKISNEDTLSKLEQMLSEQTIELAGALARKEAVTKIRDRAEEFYNLRKKQLELPKTLDLLRSSLLNRERDLQQVQGRLISPASNAMPPKVYQNKVTIYTVE
jgi:hypothetical protein